MAITASTAITKITIEENGIIWVAQIRRAFDDDGTKIGERISRWMLEPGEDVTTQPALVRRVCQAVWTQAVIDAYAAEKAAQPPLP